jgi:hypothetical protein
MTMRVSPKLDVGPLYVQAVPVQLSIATDTQVGSQPQSIIHLITPLTDIAEAQLFVLQLSRLRACEDGT